MSTPRSTSSRGQVQPAVAIVLGIVAVVGLVAAVLVSRPGPSSVAAPTARPSAAPTAVPTVAPSAAPSAGPLSVNLKSTSGHDVSVVIDDKSGTLVDALSGTPGDGMSVRWNKALVKNTDERTIIVTWAGLPLDGTANLSIAAEAGQYKLHLVQPAPYANTDAMGEDRILVLTFDTAVSADDVSVTFERAES
jgi:hypothetical protein